MFKRKFIYVLIVGFFLSACGNETSKPGVVTDSLTFKESDSVRMAAESGPMALTAGELHDDSVFSDGSVPTSWINAGITDSVKMKKFIRQLQLWVADRNVDSIAAHLRYPKNYENYFNQTVRSAVMSQKLNQVFRNQQGVMLSEGRVWLTEKDNHILIIAINN
jgi:hypothetical protein